MRLTVRATARGWQALVIGMLILGVAFLIGTTQFYQLGYALLALLAAALVLGFLASCGLRFSRTLPAGSRITVGKHARIDLRVSGGSRFGVFGLEVVDSIPDRRVFEVSAPKWRGGTVVEVPVTFSRRGIYELGPAELRARDPFGFLLFVRRFVERTEVVVYPQVHPLPGFPVRGGTVELGTRSAHGRRGDEFAGLREYRRGDDRRHIYWKSVARTGELVVKDFAVQAPLRYTVALDLKRRELRTAGAEVEDAVSTTASVLAYLMARRLPSRLVCSDAGASATEFGSCERTYWRAMRILATVRTDGDAEIGEVVWQERGKLGEGVIFVSRGPDGMLADSVRRLRGAGLPVVVVIIASHTYRGCPGSAEREARFLGEVGRMEAAGAAVCVVRHPEGVAGLAGTDLKGARA